MARQISFFLTLLLLVAFDDLRGQVIEKANRRFNDMAYAEAIPRYEKLLKKDSTNTNAWAKLGDCYRLTNESVKAERCYAKVVKDSDSPPIYKLYYALALMGNRKYEESRKWFEAYQTADPNDSRAGELAATVMNIDRFYSDSSAYTVERVPINSSESDFGTAFFKDGLVFTSSRQTIGLTKRVHSWTGKNFLSMYFVKASNGKFGQPELFAKSVQTKYNNGPACFNREQDVMYFTRNNIEGGKVKTSEKHEVKLKIFSAKLKNGEWTDVTPFKYNSDQYSCAHPCLSPDGSKLFFVSDMPGTLGGMDLWVCTRDGNSWSQPENLGPQINTRGNELFPTVSDDNTLYFSSNGREGLGGLDIYSADITPGGFHKARNMNAPINSPDDDFGLIFDPKTQTGYISSNRTQQGENDDLFSFRKNTIRFDGMVFDAANGQPLDSSMVRILEEGIEKPVEWTEKDGHFTMNMLPTKTYQLITTHDHYRPDTLRITPETIQEANGNLSVKIHLMHEALQVSISGLVFHEGSKIGVAGARVTLVNLDTHDSAITFTDREGRYTFTGLKERMNYRLETMLDTCAANSATVSTTGLTNDTTLRADIGLYCARENIVLHNIYYNLNRFNIRPDAAAELDNLVVILKKYPGMSIELRSHTDCRASAVYNLHLSQKRARSAVEYLVRHGIARTRLSAKGYGETMLVNQCECEGKRKVRCTEAEHQLNRRTEFRILVVR